MAQLTAKDYPVISKAKARLLLDHPFFATILLGTPVVPDNLGGTVEYAATDMKNIYLNPDYLKEATVSDIMSDLVHETGHNALLHADRKGTRNHHLWNIACDHAIDLMLEEQGFKAPKGGWLADARYKGWSAEKIYDDLRKEQQKSGKSPDQFAKGRMHGDLLPVAGSGQSDAQHAQTVQAMKQKVAEAAMRAKMAGKLKGELAKMVGDFLDPKVPWNEVLREFMLRIIRADESWARRNRRYSHVVLPAAHAQNRMGPIVIIGDSSGSIWASPAELEMMATEIQSVAELVQPEHIRLIWADTKVASEEVFEEGDTLRFEVKGGGGTDMRVPLEYVEQYDPEAVILLTDGYTPWPDSEPPYPLIVCCSTDAPCPVGDVIRMELSS